MKDLLPIIKRGTSLLLVIFLTTVVATAQEFRNGARKGVIRVKFTPEMTQPLSQMQVRTSKAGLSTGIKSFDAAAKKFSAKNIYRLFPYDAKYESKLRKHGLHLWYVVEIDENIDPKTAIATFRQLKEIKVAEVEREKIIAPFNVEPYEPGITTYEALPFNDPFLKDQWHYNNTNQIGAGDADVNLFEAWKTTAGSNQIIVSIHDQGVDVNHIDLKENIWTNTAELNGVSGVDDDKNGYVDDINGYNFEKNKGAVDPQYHGTHVAGTIAAVNNNGKGVSGVAGGSGNGDGVKIMSLQILGGAPIEKSYVYAANNGAVISQNSWGYTSPGFFDQAVLDAIDYFIAEAGDYPGSPMKGGIVIFAAGNSNYDGEWYPGYHPGILSVAALGPEWKKATYSNFGSWVELSAPGGDQEIYGGKGGVLSTIPKDQYAYMNGTSMACPHVSGIAALALANRTKQLTNQELWAKLVTGVVEIDQYNEEYVGMLGAGAIDASLAIQNDLGVAPEKIADLLVTGVDQEFATLSWTVPTDTDDGRPLSFQLYHHTQPITSNNLSAATQVIIKNDKTAGEKFEYEVNGLLGLTTYYFAVTSTDRWGNSSVLSNIASDTTNAGPSIAVDDDSQSISLEIDASNGTSASHDIKIFNNASGILRWDHFMRHANTELSLNAAGLNYPKASSKKSGAAISVMKRPLNKTTALRSADAEAMAFTAIEKALVSWPTDIIGETDTTLTNSAAAKFYVTESDGFNLTQVQMYLKHNPAKGPVIVEIYKGATPVKNNLIYAQEYSNSGLEEQNAYITLNEQLYFESGSTFWIVFHVPAGNLYPLGMGFESDPSNSTNCFMSFNLGASWVPMEEAINSKDFAWAMVAASNNPYLGVYLTLEPGSGDVDANDSTMTTMTAEASTLINGSYSANLILSSNDANQQELRIPVSLTVSGHKPKLRHIDIADYGSVFQGTPKTLELLIENIGHGNFNNPEFSINNPAFSIDGSAPWQIKALEEVVVKVTFSPTAPGNANGILEFTDGDQTYQISLFGVGAETSQIRITPESQVINDIAIGDVVNAQITVENTGAYPLKYFIPGYDDKGVSENWPTDYHTYGYKFRTNYATDSDPIAYQFQDISTTGVEITSSLIDAGVYYTLDMGFDFPYYGQMMKTLYIAQKGFTTFDNSVRPINSPSLNNSFNPKGFISPIGGFLSFLERGKVFYQVEADRIIVQYDDVWDGYNVGETLTAQMVLYANGDIRFFYDDVQMGSGSIQGLNVLIEDLGQSDGILIHSWQKESEIYSGLALGFDYPGPNIITHVANGSGIVAPGSSAIVDLELKTGSLVEGTTKRYVNFISNDPHNSTKNGLVQLEITSGGISRPVVSIDTIAFGNVFQDDVRSSLFVVKNEGTANVNVSSVNMSTGDFGLTGEIPSVIKPGFYKNFIVNMPTSALGMLEDRLSINYADGSHDTVYVTGNVVVAPAVNVDLSPLQEILSYGETSSHPLTIENTGLAPLEVVATGAQWMTFDLTEGPASAEIPDYSYAYELHNDGNFYQWMDIRKTGTQLPFADFDDWDNTFWRTLELPFAIDFYGVQYTSFKIGDNGIISFEDEPQASFFTDYIPSQSHSGPCIMPYWTFSGFSDLLYPKEDIGIFYQAYDDKFIITWSYFTNNFGGMGDPVSAQVIFYKNGTMKFQYKAEEGGADLTSQNSTVGLQESSENGIAFSAYQPLLHGNGLAYTIVPAKKHTIAPGNSLSGYINLNAKNIYGGVYSDALKIQTNAPGNHHLTKPVELTVTGAAEFVAEDTIDFGEKMVALESWGDPKMTTMELDFSNEGSAPYEITWAQMKDGNQGLSLMLQIDGWFGPEWAPIGNIYSEWALETPTYKVMPGEKLAVRAIFYPSVAGDFVDTLVLTTSIGEREIVMKGTGFEPPSIQVDKKPINIVMNVMSDKINKTIQFNNNDGKSELEYEVSIDFGRPETTSRVTGQVIFSGQPGPTLSLEKAGPATGIRLSATYNRVLKYTDKETADAMAGTGGGAPLTIATKFNAGPDGFNLSHVETWFRTETLDQGTLYAEIRAGGTSIANAVTLVEGSVEFTGTGDDLSGNWHPIALDHPVGIYPNEDFYVIVTLPLGIERPQGIFNGAGTVPGRYFYEEEGLWSDIQEVPTFETAGWMMFAAEETAGNSSWLTVTSSPSGEVNMGEASSVELLVEGGFATRGDQVANIVIKSNDPKNTTVRIPVKLHMNEAPVFSEVPEGLFVAENETKTIQIGVTDSEGNSFTVTPAQVYPGISPTLSNGVLSIELKPGYGDAGNYNYTFTAKDQFDAESQITIPVEVVHTNRAPAYIGSNDPLEYYATGRLNEYSIDDFFSDPDGDVFDFTVTSSNTEFVTVFASTNQFLVKPLSAGETTLEFSVTDSEGAVTTKLIVVKVNVILGVDEDPNHGVQIYPNPVEKVANISLTNEWNGEVVFEVIDLSGKQHIVQKADTKVSRDILINVTRLTKGFYILRVVSNEKRTSVKLIKE